MKVLIVEDEIELLIRLSNYLTKENYVCELAANYKTAKEKIMVYEYDVVLLDITLPDGSGIDLLRIIRKNNINAGVIIISAKSSLDDKIKGLDLGADDYMTKPFQLPELNSRIKSILRRHRFDGNNLVEFNEIIIDIDKKEVKISGEEIFFTKKEYDMLLFFMINKYRMITKEIIAEHLWNDNIDLSDNYDFIYTHLNNIRQKIKAKEGNDYIKTIYGMGYKLTDK